MVTAMDNAIGQVVGALEEAGLYQDSVILFFSDNGGPIKGWPPGHDTAYAANNWPLRGGKKKPFLGKNAPKSVLF